jgi:hypothetical protein
MDAESRWPFNSVGHNRNDSQLALALVDAIPPLQGKRGRPRHRPDCVLGDRGYDAEAIRRGLRQRRIIPFLAKRNTEHGSGLGDGAGWWTNLHLVPHSILGFQRKREREPHCGR